MLRVGIIGSGFMGVTHADAYAQLDDVSIAGFVGKGETNRKKLAAQFNTRDYPTIEALLAAQDVDVVDICTPTHLNVDMVRVAAQAKKAILIEKPVALNVADAVEIQRLVSNAGVPVMVAHVVRFWPEYAKIREIVTGGQIGHVRLATATRICQPPDWTPWYEDPKQSGGVPVTLMVHDLDFCNWLFGPPQDVTAAGHKNDLGAYDDIHALVRYGGGVSVGFRSSISMPEGYPFTMGLRVTGDAGAVEFTFRAGINIENRHEAQSDFTLYRDGKPSVPEVEKVDAYVLEIGHFLDALRAGRQPEVGTLEEATLALRTAWAAIESADSGATVKL